jgi:hypothetical protein
MAASNAAASAANKTDELLVKRITKLESERGEGVTVNTTAHVSLPSFLLFRLLWPHQGISMMQLLGTQSYKSPKPPVEDCKLNDTIRQRSLTQVSTHLSVEYPGRVMEIGFIPNFRPQEFALVFDSFPSWLLATEQSFCLHLHIIGWSLAAALKTHLEVTCSVVALVHKAVAHLGLGQVRCTLFVMTHQREL